MNLESEINGMLQESNWVDSYRYKQRYFKLLKKIEQFRQMSNSKFWKSKYKRVVKNEIRQIKDLVATKKKQKQLGEFL